MIQQRIGDLLQIEEGGQYIYVVVLTKQVKFGGNILFVFHSDGNERSVDSLVPDSSGFNVCSDLLVPKREGRVVRVHHFEHLAPFWRTKYAKSTNEYRLGMKAKEWFIHDINDLNGKHVARVTKLSSEHRAAMDGGCYSFDLVAKKALARYTPDQNEMI